MTPDKSARLAEISIDIQTDLLSTLRRMDETGAKLLIVTEAGKYHSLVSIGDLQRSIIKDRRLDKPVREALRPKDRIHVCSEKDSTETVKAEMQRTRAEFMPITDADGNLTEVYFWEEMFEEKRAGGGETLNLPVVIMAGGKGTRLKPITNIIPKPLVPVGERPIAEHIVRQFRAVGTKKFYFSVNYKADMIRRYFDELPDRDFETHYFTEEKPLGTAGSLFLLKGKVNSPFFVSNCDIIIDQDYREVWKYHRENNNELTVTAAMKHYSIPYGTLEVGENGILTDLKEKPELTFMVNAGVYLLEAHLLEEIPDNTFFHITHLIENIRKRGGRVGVFPVSENAWLDIGEWKEYRRTQEIFAERFADQSF